MAPSIVLLCTLAANKISSESVCYNYSFKVSQQKFLRLPRLLPSDSYEVIKADL